MDLDDAGGADGKDAERGVVPDGAAAAPWRTPQPAMVVTNR